MGQQNPTPRESTPQTGPSGPVPYRPPAPPSSPKVGYDPNSDQLVTKASSSRRNDRCPECGSGNYAPSAPGSQRLRCFDCGYPVMQQTSGMGNAGQGQATPAKQLPPGSGFTWNIGEKL